MKSGRRAFLQGASALSFASIAGLGATLAAFEAQAADTSGYKALVCIFLLGGLDTHDVLLPYDQASYDRYADIRAPLLAQYAAMSGGSTRARDRLLPLVPDNAANFGGRQFALTEEMSGIKGLFDSGNAAIIGNVGPLIQPLTKTEFDTESAPAPKRLFSHNDQQSTWMSSQPEGAMYGWGGRFADAVLNAGANSNSEFTTITSLGNELFLTGENVKPYQIGLNGAIEIDALEFFEGNRSDPNGEIIYQKLRDHFEAMDFVSSNLVERDIVSTMNDALTTNEAFNAALDTAQSFTTPFPEHFLGQQLRAVANTISVRDALLTQRQVFFVALGGFDTHSNQAADMPGLQTQIDTGIVAFYQAMQELGLGSNVTTFTASDFGRTLAINGDGTDHGWGSHHLVVGDAVQGRNIYGQIPAYDFGHAQDAGSGRLIPTTAVEQFAAPLGRWFGLNDAELAVSLPNLSAFSSSPLAYI